MRKAHILLLALLFALPGQRALAAGPAGVAVPVLLYHRLGPVVADSMTVRTAVFQSHLEYLKAHGYTVIPLRRLTDYIAGRAPAPPERSVAITVDDGHKSVFTDMYPLIVRYQVPVTLFIYPSAISNASYALTWEQLSQMQGSGLVDIQSHTYWHPDFKREKKRLSPDAYVAFVRGQMVKSKQVLEQRVGGRIDLLAWPFGIFDPQLMELARQAGYVAAFTLERRPAVRSDDAMAVPRYLMTDGVQGAAFARLLQAAARTKGQPAHGGEP